MSDPDREQRIQRVLVALDASPHSLAALKAATELAAELHIELLGLFVEDVNLLRLAELSFVRELSALSLRSRSLDPRYIELQLRAQAQQARQALIKMAQQARVPWSFRVTRGVIASELLNVARETDLIILGRAGRSRPGRGRLGSTARTMVLQAKAPTLILQQGSHFHPPVMLVYDGSPAARRALDVATRLAYGKIEYLNVLILAHQEDAAHRLRKQVDDWLREQKTKIEGRYLWMEKTNAGQLARLVQEKRCGVLVLPREATTLQDETISALLEKTGCPTLLVR